MINLDLSNTIEKIPFESYRDEVKRIHRMIEERTGEGNDFLGWTTWPEDFDKEEFERIKIAAKEIRENYEVLVVAGIGGSYLGARAAIEALRGLYSEDPLEIVFLGNTLSSSYIAQALKYLENKRFAINVISKSGTTTETSVAFRLLKELLIRKVGKEAARKAIFATTDRARGALKKEADAEGYETFVIPDDIGGRYSVITAVGLLPIAAAGCDIDALMKGCARAKKDFAGDDIDENICYRYAVARHYFYTHGKAVELFVTYEPQFTQIGEWLKQLFGESEGKQKKGLLPDSVTFSTDLHSLGQFIQQGSPIFFETVVRAEKPLLDVSVPHDEENLDGLNFLQGKTMSYVNEKAFEGTLRAHVDDGRVPNVIIGVEKMDAFHLGYLFYFFMRACAMSAYLLKINPFDQPGVEIYKKNMFRLLGKPGY